MPISYIICFANLTRKINIIYYFLIKYKQITYSVLVTKLHEIVYMFDIEIAIKTTLGKILRFVISLILFINLKLLYNYLVQISVI